MKNTSPFVSGSTLVLALTGGVALGARPGDQQPVVGIHPNYQIENIRPAAMDFSVGAMDFLSDGTLVVTSWRDPYGVYLLRNATGPKSGITVQEFASGLRESLGLKVLNDRIYVLQKEELTLLLDHDKDGKADEYRAISYDWTRTNMEKEYAMGLVWDGKYFYASFGDNTLGGGTAVVPGAAGRQNGLLRFSMDGAAEPFSGGLRVPGGLGYFFGEIWLTENQGGFRSTNPLYNVRFQRWYGRPVSPPSVFQPIPYRDLTDAETSPTSTLYSRPAVDMMYNQAGGRSPGNPLVVREGVFKNQILVPDCDANYAGISRNFVENVGGEFQGANFHFSRGFEGKGVFSLVTDPDGAIYAGGNGSTGAGWSRYNHVGLDRLKVKAAPDAFDMVAVRSKGASTFEIEFTKPVAANLGNDVKNYLEVQKWFNRIKMEYGAGSRQGLTALTVNSAAVSADRKKVLADISNLSTGHTIYFHWKGDVLASSDNQKLWGTEAWYTLNKFGPGQDPVENSVAVHRASYPEVQPFRARLLVSGELSVVTDLAQGKAFVVELADIQGRVRARRAGAGTAELRFSAGEVPAGLHVVNLKAGGSLYRQLGHR